MPCRLCVKSILFLLRRLLVLQLVRQKSQRPPRLYSDAPRRTRRPRLAPAATPVESRCLFSHPPQYCRPRRRPNHRRMDCPIEWLRYRRRRVGLHVGPCERSAAKGASCRSAKKDRLLHRADLLRGHVRTECLPDLPPSACHIKERVSPTAVCVVNVLPFLCDFFVAVD